MAPFENASTSRHLDLSRATLGISWGRLGLECWVHIRKAARDAGVDFIPQDAVRWFSPSVPARAGLRVVLGALLGSYLDKRELQQSFPSACVTRHGHERELWLDFIADTGDGFDATYSIAWTAGREHLKAVGSDRDLPRAKLLVLGGDQAYPSAGPSAYRHRFSGPFRAALPLLDEDEAPSLVAIPGNHDWHDGLTAFVRVFTQERWIGAWRSVQRRSYAAVQLPHGWWLWAIDLQKGADLDAPQLQYFEEIARGLMGPEAKVILCVPDPAWVDAADDPRAHRALDYFERRILAPSGARVMLTLSGDSHHYAHYVGDNDTHKITAGGGGAFLHPTHHLPETITLESHGPRDDRTSRPWGGDASGERSSVTYRLEGRCYPTRKVSRRLAWRAVGLPLRNPSFLVVPALVHLVLLTTNSVGLTELAGDRPAVLDANAPTLGYLDLAAGLLRSPSSILIASGVTALLVGFAKAPPRARRRSRRAQRLVRISQGVAHGMCQMATVVAVELVGLELAGSSGGGHRFTMSLVALVAGLGGVAGSLVLGTYLAANCALFGAHGNEAFSSLRLTRHKCFVRMHIGPDGRLTVYPLGMERVWRRWRPGDHHPGVPVSGRSMLVPDGQGSETGPMVHLIEPPFDIG